MIKMNRIKDLEMSVKIRTFGMIFFPMLQIVWTILWINGILIRDNIVWLALLGCNVFLFWHYSDMRRSAIALLGLAKRGEW